MQNPQNQTPQKVNYMPLFALGCATVGLLTILCAVVFGAMSYLNGTSLPLRPALTPTSTLLPTETASPSPTFASTPTFTASPLPTETGSPFPTFIFRPPTSIPTRTRTPRPAPTKTRTPTSVPQVTTYHDAHFVIAYSAWEGALNGRALGKTLRCAAKKNQTMVFVPDRNSAAVSVVFYRGPNQGKAKIYIDNALADTLDLYHASPQYGFEKKYTGLDPSVPHTLKVTALRQKRNASSDFRVCVDGFRVGRQFVDEMQPSVRYGAWAGALNNRALGGAYRVSSQADSSVTFIVQGPSFQWITARGPRYGQAAVYVDGRLLAKVDLYSPSQRWQQAIPFTRLGRGAHTVRIVTLGLRHPDAGGDAVVFDGFRTP